MSEAITDDMEVLEPSHSIRYQSFGLDTHLHTYAQKPLSFFGKMELFALLGATVNHALKEGQISVSELLDRSSEFSVETLRETDTLIRAIAAIVEVSPEFLADLYCVSLGVPKGEREYAKALMMLPEDEGGLSDNDGVAILDTFIDQNWEAIFDFFKEKMMPLFQKVSSKAQDSASSKPLKATQRRTRKA